MDQAERFVSAAILGQDPSQMPNVDGIEPSTEPAPLFYVIFGLIFEALASPPTQPTSAVDPNSNTGIASLRALKSLIDPRYSGKALLEPAVFKEFFSLCHRMAMVENARTLVHLLEVIHVFSKHFGHLGTEGVMSP